MKLLNLSPLPKLQFPAGLISLILLPILCLVYLYKHKAFVNYRITDVAFYNPASVNHLSKESRFKPYLPHRQFQLIELTGNDDEDKISLDFAQVLLRRYRQQKDTLHAIHIHFGPKSHYWSLVRAIDICHIEEIDIFMPYQNNFYAYGYFKPKHNLAQSYHPLLYDDIVYHPQDETQKSWDERLSFVKESIQRFWAPIIFFLLMLFSAVNNSNRFSKKLRLSSKQHSNAF